MQLTIAIEGKLLGRAKPLFANWCVPLPIQLSSDSKRLTLRELLTEIILKDIEAFRTRQEKRRLIHVLTKSQIQQGVELGKVEMGGSDLQHEVDSQAAVDSALQAFEDGLYFVFVDEEQHKVLGKEKWRELDKAAKYASTGHRYKRVQLFANAMLGQKEIQDPTILSQILK